MSKCNSNPSSFLMDNIKLDWIWTKRDQKTSYLNKKQFPTLLLLLILQSTPASKNFSEHLTERKKSFGLTFEFWLLSVLLTKSEIWTLSFIGLITWFDWKTHHNEMTMWFLQGWYSKLGSELATFLTLFCGRGAWIRKIWSGTILLSYVQISVAYL